MSAAESSDGYDYTVVLACGDWFRWNSAGKTGDLDIPKVGWYFCCSHHSPVRDYNPDDGSPNYDRNQQVVEVRHEMMTTA